MIRRSRLGGAESTSARADGKLGGRSVATAAIAMAAGVAVSPNVATLSGVGVGAFGTAVEMAIKIAVAVGGMPVGVSVGVKLGRGV